MDIVCISGDATQPGRYYLAYGTHQSFKQFSKINADSLNHLSLEYPVHEKREVA
jgi:hypothetical protein